MYPCEPDEKGGVYEHDDDQFPEHLHSKYKNADEVGAKTS